MSNATTTRLRLLDGDVGKNRHGQTMASFECVCGKQVTARRSAVLNGYTRSCGCLKSESTIRRNMRHGMKTRAAAAPEYAVWSMARKRCRLPSDRAFHRYGGRGIRMCDRWADSFADFIADMGQRPSPKHSLDRIDNDGNYEPGNCRWVTRTVQARNTRTNRLVEAFGEKLCIAAWAEKTGIRQHILIDRLGKLGWTPERALSTPAQSRTGPRERAAPGLGRVVVAVFEVEGEG